MEQSGLSATCDMAYMTMSRREQNDTCYIATFTCICFNKILINYRKLNYGTIEHFNLYENNILL